MSRDMTISELLRTMTPVAGQKQPVAEVAPLSLDSNSTAAPIKEQKRCGCCKKKLALTDFACTKCSTRYCSAHRLPEEHTCPHDFRKEGRDLLSKQNPRVINDKVDQI